MIAVKIKKENDIISKDMGNNFKLILTADSKDYKGTLSLYEHEKTKFRVATFRTEDIESFFSFSVYTPPEDSSGVFHILEHTVLSGSEKYPVKDPFSKAMALGVPTFMNAMTGVDRTYYLAASPVEKDFDNIFSVYADAVFKPLLRKETFMQEGIRISTESDPHFEGVVFSEMLGASSQHENVLSSLSARPLFPDSPLSFESGGDPKAISALTYEKYLEMYKKTYVPSNMTLFLYGSFDMEEKLDFLDRNYLSSLSYVPKVKRIENVRRTGRIYRKAFSPLQEGETGKASVLISWRLSSSLDRIEQMIIQIVVDLLLGSSGCPLYKAIASSDLGEDLSSESGYTGDYIDNVFSAGFSGCDEKNSGKIEDFILAELEKIVSNGFSEKEVEAALRRFEFNLREIPGGLPQGMRVFFRLDRALAYDGKVESYLSPSEDMKILRKMVEEDRNFFSSWIERNLVKNPDRLVAVVVCDENAQKIEKDAIDKVLSARLLSWDKGDEELFRVFSLREDSRKEEENFVRLVPEDVKSVKFRANPKAVDKIAFAPLYTSGIIYFDLAIDVSDFSLDELVLVNLYVRLMTMESVGNMDISTFQTEMRYNTGSFAPYLETGSTMEGKEKAFLIVRMKLLPESANDGVDLLIRLFQDGKFIPEEIRMALTDMSTDYQAGLIQNGHTFAITLSSEDYSPSLYMGERLSGIRYWYKINELLSDYQNIPNELVILRKKIVDRSRMSINVTAEDNLEKKSRQISEHFLSAFNEECSLGTIKHDFPIMGRQKVFHLPSSVSYMAITSPSGNVSIKEGISDSLFLSILSSDLLWDKIRAKGGAYGTGALADVIERTYHFYSYRDPRLDETYEDIFSAIKEETLDDDKLTSAILQRKANDLKPLAPSQKSKIYLRRRLFSISDDYRRKVRSSLDLVTMRDVENARERILSSLEREHSVAILASHKMVEASRYFKEGEDLPF